MSNAEPQNRADGMLRLPRIDAGLIDAGIALLLGAASLAVVIGRSGAEGDFREDTFVSGALVLLQTLPLAVRRRYPLGVLGVITAALVAHSAIGYEVVQYATLGSWLATFGAASQAASRRDSIVIAAITAAGLAGFFITNRGEYGFTDVVATSVTWAIAWFAGTFVRIYARLVEQGQRQTRELQTLLELSSAVTSTLDLQELYETALDRLADLIPYTGAAIQEADTNGTRQVATRRPPGIQGEPVVRLPGWNQTSIIKEINSGRAVIIGDVRGDEPKALEYRETLGRDIDQTPLRYFRSWMSVPLVVKEKVIGNIGIVHERPAFFGPEHVELAQSVANHVAIAIENARLFQESEHRTASLQAMLEMSQAVTSTLELQALFEVALDRLRDVIPYTGANLSLRDGAQSHQVASRRPDGISTGPVVRRPGWEQSPIMQDLASGKTIVISDMRSDEHYAIQFKETLGEDIETSSMRYFRSLITVPLIAKSRVIGDLSVTHAEPGYFRPEDVEIVQTVANHVAIAIENAHLFEESARKARELGALLDLSRSVASTLDVYQLFEVTLDRLRDLVPYSGGSIALRTEEGLRYATIRRPTGDKSPMERRPGWPDSNYMKTLTGGTPVRVDDLRGEEPFAVEYRSWLIYPIEDSPVAYARSMLAVPLAVKGIAFGDVTLTHEQPAYFKQEHAELVQTVANHLAIAIENARLFDETSRKAAEVAALLQANEVLHHSLSLPEVFRALVDVSVEVLGVDMSAVMLRESPDGKLLLRAHRGFPEFITEAAQTYLERAAIQLPERGSVWAVADTLTSPEAIRELTVDAGMRATLQVPLRVGSTLGVFVFGYREPHTWNEDEVKLCQSLAERASVAIQNALLFEESESHAREMEALYRADEKLFSSLDLDDVFQTLADIAVEVIGADKSMVSIADSQSGEFMPKAWRNVSGDMLNYYREVRRPQTLEAGSGLAAVEDIRTADSELRDVLLKEGIQATLTVPIMFEGRASGAFGLAWDETHRSSDEEKRLCLALAQRAAVAINNAALYARAQQAASLEERQRLARELHDSVSQALYGIALGARTARTQLDRDPTKAGEPLDYVLSLAEAGLAEMRALIFELRPESLETEGLVAALEKQLAATRARHGLDVAADLSGEPAAALEVKEAAYRIAQEALHNVVKHAQAKSVRVALSADSGGLRLTIADDGRGFDASASFPGHIGLQSMRERAERAGGSLEIESAPGKGTTITARFPAR
jgi:GAF domain-containing protein